MSRCFGGQKGDKVQEGDLYHQGMEPGGEHRELSGAGTTYPGVKQLDVALENPFHLLFTQISIRKKKFLSLTPAGLVGGAEIYIPLFE